MARLLSGSRALVEAFHKVAPDGVLHTPDELGRVLRVVGFHDDGKQTAAPSIVENLFHLMDTDHKSAGMGVWNTFSYYVVFGIWNVEMSDTLPLDGSDHAAMLFLGQHCGPTSALGGHGCRRRRRFPSRCCCPAVRRVSLVSPAHAPVPPRLLALQRRSRLPGARRRALPPRAQL